ncbi:DUF4260 domain-containing protein [Salinimicrobium sp. GXAS 041]|uniref:DUF4260 domain-containing protein n=1 Tax=Salinimicrobium sp. GXAS 041 TaxID=3400806 RepID=UPI003C70AEF0
MKIILKLEELAMFLLGIFAFNLLNFDWWWFLALLFTPDVGILGYLFGNKAGAITYNLFHHKAVAVLVFLAGFYFTSEVLQLAGIIFFAHAAFDRMLGYGLKYEKGFKFTHLGEIGGNGKNLKTS